MMRGAADRAGLPFFEVFRQQHGAGFFRELSQMVELRAGRLPFFLGCLHGLFHLSVRFLCFL